MSAKRAKPRMGRPLKVPGEKGTKERIFDAALELFAENGYDDVSIRDIGRAVGVSESAIYRHYADKEAILDAILNYVRDRIYATPSPGWNVDMLVEAASVGQILEGMPREMASDPNMLKITRIMLIEMYHNDKIQEYVRRELFERPVEETEIIFRKLIEKGKIRPCNPHTMSALFISYLVYWYFEAFIFSYGEPGGFERSLKEAQAMVKSFAGMLEPAGEGC